MGDKELWKKELKEEINRNRKENKPNGFQYFTLGFSIATLIFNTIVLILKLRQL